MHFWREQYFKTLKDVAAEASETAEWADYALFCLEYERGLRLQAFATLKRFVASIGSAPFQERRLFVSWLMQRADGKEGQHMLIPHPLRLGVIEPTLLEWKEVEPRCSEPHRWLGGYEHLKLAVELQPDDELSRRKLIASILGRVGFATHELPVGYLGVAHDDLSALIEAEALLQGLSSDEERKRFAAQISEERTLIEEHLRGR
jgi:hypothetical protein